MPNVNVVLACHSNLRTSRMPSNTDCWCSCISCWWNQDLIEFHTIGSPPLIERLVADLLAAGARAARPGEFTLRAFLAGKLDLPQAEAVHAVIEASSDSDLTLALTQLAGRVTQPLHALRDDLLNLLADTEAALDFADEDITFVGKPETLSQLAIGIARLINLRRQFDDRSVSGRRLRVVLAGLPNAGKSSLFNALSGNTGAIVSPIPGTTRDYLTCSLDIGSVAVELIDTAGWMTATDTIEDQAQRLGEEQANRADVMVWCVESGTAFDPIAEDRFSRQGVEIIRVITKSDLARGEQPPSGETGILATSTIVPGGIEPLRQVLTERLAALARPPLAPSQSRCRHHLEGAIRDLQTAHHHVLFDEPAELTALALRSALHQLGEMVGAVYTNDLLDRIFSRFCIGK